MGKIRTVILVLLASFVALAGSLPGAAQEGSERELDSQGPITPSSGNPPVVIGSPLPGPLGIPDNDPAGVGDSIGIPTVPAQVFDLDVGVTISHTWVGDLVVTLTHEETGTSVTLIDRPGTPPGTFGCGGDDINATLDDEAATPVEGECGGGVPAISGTFSPNGALSAFDGESIGGTWTLNVADVQALDEGSLTTWSLSFTPGAFGDDFDLPIKVPALPSTGSFETAKATTAGDDPLETCSTGTPAQNSNSVWFQVKVPSDRQVNISTAGSNYDTVLAVYTGSRGSLAGFACNDDGGGGGTSSLHLLLQGGTTYHVEVADRGSTPGGGTLQISFTPKAADPDGDLDGCPDSREAGLDPALGGMRDANNGWDFFDTPGSGNERDQVIDAGDLFRVVARFGTSGDIFINPLSPPPPSGYHTAFDRSAPSPGGDPWDLNPPDGSVDVSDIFFSVNQFGHSCV